MIPFHPFFDVEGGFLGTDIDPLRNFDLTVEDFFQVKQVHGNNVAFLNALEHGPGISETAADAIVTALPEISLAIRTADCVPILVAHPQGVVAAVHAGWKGTALRILPKTIEFMVSTFKLDRPSFHLTMGPAICSSCFEVGEDVAVQFKSLGGPDILRDGAPGKFHLDLKKANLRQASEAGVPTSQIELRPECTRCLSKNYHSYREMTSRGVATAGRNYSWIRQRAK